MNTAMDVQLHGDVIGELECGPRLDISRVAVAVRSGVVTLSGSVPSNAAKWATEEAVRRVCGVLSVSDELTVFPFAELHTDRDIAEAARWALEWNVMALEKSIHISALGGWLTLEGEVERQDQCQSAQDAVARLRGVRGVTNLLTFRPQAAFRHSASLDASRVGRSQVSNG